MNEPKSAGIYRDLRRRIVKGDWPERGKLPRQSVLAQEYKVSLETMRQAIYDLVNDGYLYSRQGHGTFVREKRYWPENDSVQRYGRIVGMNDDA